MIETTSLLTWDVSEAQWASVPIDVASGELRVADSWVIADGRVCGWDLHMGRFTSSCVSVGAERSALDAAIRVLPAAMPQSGEWFPRLEMRGEGSLYLRLRARPPRWESARAWPTDQDPRQSPKVKGPDIDRLMRLRAEARAHGAEEAAILNGRGEVIEAAGCSVVWWRGEALFRVAASEPILDGVTQRLLAELARRLDVQFTESSLSVEEVCEHEVWLVNALIGIVPVIGWVDRCERSPLDSSRLATWRAGLAELALPVG